MDNSQIPNGFIMLSRQVFDSDIFFRKPTWFKWWIYLILKANHTTKRYRGKIFSRGELLLPSGKLEDIASYQFGNRLANHENKHTKHRFMNYLRKEEMVTTRKTTRGLIVKITNYDYYQTGDNYTGNNKRNPDNNEATNDSATIPQLPSNTINKNDKELEESKEKRSDSSFSSVGESLNSYSITQVNDGSTKWKVEAKRFANKLEINFKEVEPGINKKWFSLFELLDSRDKMGIANAVYSQLSDSPTEFKNNNHLINTFIKIAKTRLSNK